MPKTLTKNRIAKDVAFYLSITFRRHHKARGKAHDIVDVVLRVVTETLQRGEPVFIPGFGTFTHYITPSRPRTRAYSYKGRPLRKGDPHYIGIAPEKRRVIFKPSKVLNRIINADMP